MINSPDLRQPQVEAESVDTVEFRKLAMAWSDAATECWPSKALDGWNAMIAHIENYVAARATAERKEGYESQLPRIRHLEHERDAARRAARDNSRAIVDEYRAAASESSAAIRELNSALAASQAAPAKAEGWVRRNFSDLALGARFKYLEGEQEYVLLDRTGSGLVAHYIPTGIGTAFQGIYSAFDSEVECRNAEVLVAALSTPAKEPT